MEFSEVVRRRRMVRAFDSRPLPREAVERLLAYAQRGPSSGFTQGFEFLVFDGPAETGAFWDAGPAMREYLAPTAAAPLIIVPFAHEQAYVDRYLQPDKVATNRRSGADFPAPYWFIDSAFASMLVLLGAVDEGLGAFYFSVGANRRDVESFVKRFAVPEAYWPAGAIAIGYPAEGAAPPAQQTTKAQRRPSEHVIHRGRWQSADDGQIDDRPTDESAMPALRSSAARVCSVADAATAATTGLVPHHCHAKPKIAVRYTVLNLHSAL